MKSISVACAIFAAVALAQPHGNHRRFHKKRDVVTEVEWVTHFEYVTQLVDATTTVWVTPGQEKKPEATSTTEAVVEKPTTSAAAGRKKQTSVEAPASVPTTSTTSIYTPPPAPETSTTKVKEEYTPPAETTSTSVYVAPPQPTTIVTSVYTPPAQHSTTAAQAPKSTQGSASGSSGASGSSHSGELTYYAVGFGACGEDDGGKDNSDNIVALSHLFMGTQSNGNPYCGKKITIEANGNTAYAIVKDKCMGCAIDDIDVSEKVYKELWGSLTSGRTPAKWYFSD